MEFHGRDISPGLVERAEACTTPEELLSLVKSDGVEISDEDFESIPGGAGSWDADQNECPNGQRNLVHVGSYPAGHAVFDRYECTKCGYQELV